MLPAHYDDRLVTLSVSIAICAAYAGVGVAERVTVSRGRWKAFWISGGACALGTAIAQDSGRCAAGGGDQLHALWG
jgi:NO-binding membrane sensor protein with MHYT domain